MKTAEEMYNFARQNKLGFNWIPWIQKQHFKLIEENLLDTEEVLVSFIGRYKADASGNNINYNQHFNNAEERRRYMQQQAQDGGNNQKIGYWDCSGFYAFAITSEGRFLYSHWRPFAHDAMSIPLSNINNVNPSTRMIWGSVKVETFGDNFSIFWTSGTVRRITKIIQKGISDGKDGTMDGITGGMRATGQAQGYSGNNSYDRLASGRSVGVSSNGKYTGESGLDPDDIKDKLNRLKALYEDGTISKEDFEDKKEDLLNKL